MTDTGKLPRHVAIVMDGNGRWAKERGLERTHGHIQGVESVRVILKAARVRGIEYLTMYVFSTENWGRPRQEVDMLMELFCRSVINEIDELTKEGVRVRMIGDRGGLSPKVLEHIEILEQRTESNSAINLVFAMNYSSRHEIANAARRVAGSAASGELEPESIDAENFSHYLYTESLPDPDLIIRTGGEMRLSNFLLWQGAYSELYFTKTYWPDFREEEFDKALADYAGRERRFGLVKQTGPEV